MSKFNCRYFNENKDKLFLAVFVSAIALYMAFSCTYFAGASQSVREDVVRLHILANSDSEYDQAIKLRVRDALLETNALILTSGVNTENAPIYFQKSKEDLQRTAQKVLKENGVEYKAIITLEKEYYETREYGELTFPPGEYTSLKVVLGEGEGHNWWCVMFPPLCVPAADDIEIKNNTEDYLTVSGNRIVNGGKKYVMKFKLLELYEELRDKAKCK